MDSPPTIGILSTSAIVTKVLPALLDHFTVVGVASRDAARGQAFCEEHGIAGKGFLHAEMLADPSIDAVYVPLPSGVRNSYLREAIESGKHVYTEKPMGGTVEEIAELTALALAHNVQWLDGTMWYHSPRTAAIAAKLSEGAIGAVSRVSASFTFAAPDEAWLNGGNGRTDKTREPMGCLGDQGWYPISAILFAYGWKEMPIKVMATHTTFNTVDTIVACAGTMWFEGGRSAVFDCGCTAAHRSQFEIVGLGGTIRVDDLVGGQGRSGNFAAYETKFVGSGSYVLGDAAGKDEVVAVPEADHVDDLVRSFRGSIEAIQGGGDADQEWPKRSLMVHTVMSKLFESAMQGARIVEL